MLPPRLEKDAVAVGVNRTSGVGTTGEKPQEHKRYKEQGCRQSCPQYCKRAARLTTFYSAIECVLGGGVASPQEKFSFLTFIGFPP